MLLDDIIDLLSNSGSLEGALLKTKMLMRQLGHKELSTWVNSELSGYPEGAELPTYRCVHSTPHATVILNGWQWPDTLLPITTISDDLRDNLTKLKVGSSIGTVEEQVKTYRAKGTGLVRQLSPDYMPALAKGLAKGAVITAAWCELNMAEMEAIVIQVRSRLLDFCLEVQEKLGVVSEQELPTKAKTIDTPGMFQTIVYGGTVIVGGSNIQVNNQQGDIEGLLKEVAKLGYDKAELEELRQAVIEDKSKGENPTITEGATSKWYLKALKKVGTGVRDAGVDIISKVLSESLKNYN
jgi:AbiTii